MMCGCLFEVKFGVGGVCVVPICLVLRMGECMGCVVDARRCSYSLGNRWRYWELNFGEGSVWILHDWLSHL